MSDAEKRCRMRGYRSPSQSERMRSARESTGSISQSVLSRSKQIALTAPTAMARMLPGDPRGRNAARHGQQELFIVVAAPVDIDETPRDRVRRTRTPARYS